MAIKYTEEQLDSVDKSYTANMLAAYYDRSENTEELFQDLAISKDKSYQENLDQYDVIKINMQEFLSVTNSMDI